MFLQTSDKLDPYEILAPIREGGIGEAKGAFMMNCGKVIYNWSKYLAIPSALLLSLGTLCVPKARAQASPSIVVVNFKTATATPLNPGFNGFNYSLRNAVEYYDPNLQHILTTLSPGWLSFPGGTDSEAFDWASGEIVSAWVDALAAKPYTHDINAADQPIVAGKGGSSFSDFAALAAHVGGAKIIVSVNAYTDTPQSAGAFAQYALTNHIPVAAWELANEPYTWLKIAGQGGFFTDAADYATKMKPYRDAIKAADPNAVVTLYFSEAGHPDKAWDNALASYSPKYWDAVTYHEYVFPGDLTTFDDLMAAANGNLFSNTTSYVTDYLMPRNNSGVSYVISEVSPSGGQGGLLLGSLYGGIYSAEFALRMSTLPQVKYVASFQMLSNAGVDETNPNLKVVETAYNNGTTINTSGLNFGFFLSAQAAGEAIANGALHNSIGVYTTTTTGGPTAPVQGGSIPAVYAQAYEGGNSKRYVVLTNKGASTAVAQIMQDGAVLTNAMQMTFVTGTDPGLVNVGVVPDNVQIQTQTVANPGAVTIPPYGVVRFEWTASLTPQISTGGIVIHAGSSATVSPGSIVDIYGTNLATAAVNAPAGSLPTSLGGVQVLVKGTAAPLIYVGPLQIVFQMPYETTVGTSSVVVINNNAASAAAPVTVQQAAPFILTYGSANNRAIAVNPDTNVNGSDDGAKPGDVLVAYLIGSGPLDNPIATGAAASSSPLSREKLATTVTVGGSTASVQFSGMTPGYAGLMQINFVMPNLGPGDYPIQVTIGGTASNQPLLTVSR